MFLGKRRQQRGSLACQSGQEKSSPAHTMGTATCRCYRGVVASAVRAGGKVLGDSEGGQHCAEVELRARERMSQESRAFEKGRQSGQHPGAG